MIGLKINNEESYIFHYTVRSIFGNIRIDRIQYVKEMPKKQVWIDVNEFLGVSTRPSPIDITFPLDKLMIGHFKVGAFRRRKYLIFKVLDSICEIKAMISQDVV